MTNDAAPSSSEGTGPPSRRPRMTNDDVLSHSYGTGPPWSQLMTNDDAASHRHDTGPPRSQLMTPAADFTSNTGGTGHPRSQSADLTWGKGRCPWSRIRDIRKRQAAYPNSLFHFVVHCNRQQVSVTYCPDPYCQWIWMSGEARTSSCTSPLILTYLTAVCMRMTQATGAWAHSHTVRTRWL